MRIVFRRINFRSLRERLKKEIILAALIVCIFTFLVSGMVLFIDTYDALYNNEIQQCYEVLKGASVESGHNWWESKEIRLWTGRYQYNIDFMPYWTRIYDVVDVMNEELRDKRVMIQYRERLWSSRSVVGMKYDGKVYVDSQETLALWERRVNTRDLVLALYVMLDLLILIPMTLGIIGLEKKNGRRME